MHKLGTFDYKVTNPYTTLYDLTRRVSTLQAQGKVCAYLQMSRWLDPFVQSGKCTGTIKFLNQYPVLS